MLIYDERLSRLYTVIWCCVCLCDRYGETERPMPGWVFACVRKREIERQRERQREAERERGIEREGQRERDTERERGRERETEIERVREREKERERGLEIASGRGILHWEENHVTFDSIHLSLQRKCSESTQLKPMDLPVPS